MMDELFKAQLGELIMQSYGVDINEADFRFSTQNYAFIFPEKPYMIRVSITPKKSRKEILSELMWIDDLKQFKETICEPSPSLNGKLLEEFKIGNTTYRASMFRTAKGNIKDTRRMDPMYFICVGDLLGTIHKVSTEERIMGMKYQRQDLETRFSVCKDRVSGKMKPEVIRRIAEIESKVNALSKHPGMYGLCHGDFHGNNFFVEGNNIWLFDFDGCVYADYLYDIASFVQDCLMRGYKPEKSAKAVLYEDILPYFKIGYNLNKHTSERYWNNLELMISYRTALAAMALSEIEVCGVVDNLDSYKEFYNSLLLSDSILDAMDYSRKNGGLR